MESKSRWSFSKKEKGFLISGIVLMLLIAVFPVRIFYGELQIERERDKRLDQFVEENQFAALRLKEIKSEKEEVQAEISELETTLANLQQRAHRDNAGAHGFHRWVNEAPVFVYDAVMSAAENTIAPLFVYDQKNTMDTSLHTREENFAQFEALGIEDVNGAFTRLFLDDTRSYIVTSPTNFDRCVSTYALGVYQTNQGPEGQTIGYHPYYQYDWTIVDLTDTTAIVLAEVELTFVSDTVYDKALPVVILINLEGADTLWEVTSVETYLRYGTRAIPPEGTEVKDWVGNKLIVQ